MSVQHSAFSIQRTWKASPSFNERDPKVTMQYIVLHYTGMGAEEWIAAICDSKTELSAHYLVDEGGMVTQLVDEEKRAWHAGKSFWRGEQDLNSASIGIELVNPGHELGYRPFPPVQIASLKRLLTDIVRRHGMNAAEALLSHAEIAPARKKDPGELFPWHILAQEGLGLWPEPGPEDYGFFDMNDVTDLLDRIGYDISDPSAALLAFQRRYFPENLSGEANEETVARLKALVRMVG